MKKQWITVVFSFLWVTMIGLLVFVVFSHMRPVFPGIWDWSSRLILMLCLLVFGLYFKKIEQRKAHSFILLSFFTALFAMTLDFYLPTSRWILTILNIDVQTPIGMALDKLDSTIIIVFSVIIWSKVFGKKISDLYLSGGQWKKSFKVGTIAFIIASIAAYFIAVLFGAQPYSLTTLIGWVPFILIFIAGNAFNEELLFRGQFLGPNETIMPKNLANVAIAIPFVFHHTGINYTNDTLIFLIFLFPLAFFWGRMMQNTKSIWGSFLFHAGMDIPVIIAIFSGLS